MSPDQVDRCSFWQFRACIDGFNRANGGEDKLDAPTDEIFDAMLEGRFEND